MNGTLHTSVSYTLIVQNTTKTFLCKTGSKENFMSALSSTDIQGQFESFNAKDYPSIDSEISHFNKLMMCAAKISLVPSKKKWKNTKKSKPWYDNKCRQLKKQLQHLAKKMTRGGGTAIYGLYRYVPL